MIKLGVISRRHLFGIGALAGALVFIIVYGIDVLNFQNTEWLKANIGEDLGQVHLGWMAYRASPWHGFFGIVSNVVYPNLTNIIMFDLNPPFAIFFKIISPILPQEFQYIGFAGLICCMLQGGLGVLIVRELTDDILSAILGGLLFLFTLPLYQRLFLHPALASQWLILLAYYIFLRKDSIKGVKDNLFVWGCLLVMTAYTHMYIFPIISVFMGFYLLEDIIKEHKWKEAIIVGGGALTMTFFALLLLMGPDQLFAKSNASSTEAFGAINANLNAFFNPIDWVNNGLSEYYFYFLPKIPVVLTKAQYASGGYLGFGVLLGFFATLIMLFIRPINEIKKYFTLRHALIAAGAFILFILSMWPDIALNDVYLLKGLPYPSLFTLWGSSQRFIWGSVYFFYVCFIYIALKELPIKKAQIFLLFCLLIQIIDFIPTLKTYRNLVQHKIQMQSDFSFKKPLWEILPQRVKHITFMPVEANWMSVELRHKMGNSWIQRVVYYAVQNKITTTETHLSRFIEIKKFIALRQTAYDAITNGTPDVETAYIFDEIPNYVIESNLLNVYEQDGYFIGLKNPLPTSSNYKKLDRSYISSIASLNKP